jgi:drug/metabolite transporter superfamily protein YnfA
MSLPLVFRIFSGIFFINFIGATFVSEVWLEQANFVTSPSIITLSQAFGVSLLGTAFIAFRVPVIAGENLAAFGQVFSIISLFFVVLIGYHLLNGQVAGPTATVNLLLNIIFSALFFVSSKK